MDSTPSGPTESKDSNKSGENDPGSAALAVKSRKQWLIENLTSLGLAILLVFMVRSSVIEAFKIPSGSMIPTLLIGDHIFVNKFAYGIKVPFSDWIFHDPTYIVRREPPKSGDIIVFMYPGDESIYFIKRVIGTPGDTVEIRNKVLMINGKTVSREPLPPPQAEKIFGQLDDPKYGRNNLEIFSEHLANADHTMMLDKTNYFAENYGPMQVPADKFFVMGDNRDFSNDSRFWGFVPMGNIKGKAVVIWLSLWINLSESQFTFKWWRMGTLLH